MAALLRSLVHVGPAQWVVAALALSVACATVEETDVGGGSGPNRGGSTSGGSSGALAGSGTATAGRPPANAGGSIPGSSGTGAGTTPGAPSTSGGTSAAAGGAPATTGGAPATTGGAPATTGGVTSGTCPQYSGALAADSLIFMGGFGRATTGTWSGYGYTYKYGPATVTPGSTGTACFVGAKFCANGTVPASNEAGAGLGWNISQMMGASTMAKVPITTPVKLTFGGVSAGMRVQLSASDTVAYCYTLTAADLTTPGTVTIAHTSFKTECWGTAGTAYDGLVPIEAIQVAVPGSAAGTAQTFDICIKDIEPGG